MHWRHKLRGAGPQMWKKVAHCFRYRTLHALALKGVDGADMGAAPAVRKAHNESMSDLRLPLNEGALQFVKSVFVTSTILVGKCDLFSIKPLLHYMEWFKKYYTKRTKMHCPLVRITEEIVTCCSWSWCTICKRLVSYYRLPFQRYNRIEIVREKSEIMVLSVCNYTFLPCSYTFKNVWPYCQYAPVWRIYTKMIQCMTHIMCYSCTPILITAYTALFCQNWSNMFNNFLKDVEYESLTTKERT